MAKVKVKEVEQELIEADEEFVQVIEDTPTVAEEAPTVINRGCSEPGTVCPSERK